MYSNEKELQIRVLHTCAAKHKEKKPLELFTLRCGSFDDLALGIRLHRNQEKSYDFYSVNGIRLNFEDFFCLSDKDLVYASPSGHAFCVLSFLDDFQIQHELGKGGFGTVYLAKHRVTEELRAIKIIRGNELASIEEFGKLFQEVKVLGALSHPGIEKLYSSFSYNGKIIVLLEYIPGRTLGAYLGESPSPTHAGSSSAEGAFRIGAVSESDARDIMSQLLDVISYCHSQRYVHRDLKLDNVLMVDSKDRGSPVVKLIDFGIARKCFEVSGAGTLKYSPPEVVSGSCLETSPAIDVWALGVILYRMVVGSFPFNGETHEEVRQSILTRQVFAEEKEKALVPRPCRDLLRRMLEKDRDRRIKLDDVLTHPWVRDNGRPVDCTPRNAPDCEDAKGQGGISPAPTSPSDSKDLNLNGLNININLGPGEQSPLKIIRAGECLFAQFMQKRRRGKTISSLEEAGKLIRVVTKNSIANALSLSPQRKAYRASDSMPKLELERFSSYRQVQPGTLRRKSSCNEQQVSMWTDRDRRRVSMSPPKRRYTGKLPPLRLSVGATHVDSSCRVGAVGENSCRFSSVRYGSKKHC